MAAADTNVLVRLLTADDRRQAARAEEFLAGARPLWISTVVLVETSWVLLSAYEWSKPQLLAALRGLSDSVDFTLQASEAVREAVDLYAGSKADFTECLALALARAERQLPFGTFDRQAARLAGAKGL